MKNKKIIILSVFIILFLIINFYFINLYLIKTKPFKKPTLPCAKEGERIHALNEPESCCPGLKDVGYSGSDCNSPMIPTGITKCTNCGNGICDIKNGEGKCSCPEDCK